MQIFFSLAAILALSLVLIKSADLVVLSIKVLTRDLGTRSVILATLLVGLATSIPELVVGVTAALSGLGALSLGNIVGANIANLSLVIGLAGLLGGTVFIKDEKFVRRDLPLVLVAGLAPIALLGDRNLSRVDGLLLLVVYGAYAYWLFHERFVEIGKGHKEGAWHKFLRSLETGQGSLRRHLVKLFAGVFVLLLSASLIVRVASSLATSLGVPLFLIGLLVVSVGTTLPELVFSYRSIKDHSPSLLLGTILGSIVVNSTLILGLVALISPISIQARREYLPGAMAFVFLIVIFWIFTHTKRRLERWEAGVLLAVYVLFVFLIFNF